MKECLFKDLRNQIAYFFCSYKSNESTKFDTLRQFLTYDNKEIVIFWVVIGYQSRHIHLVE